MERQSLPANNVEYLDINYWNKRFEEEECYEWCKSYQDFRHLVVKHLQPHWKILILGCGNSALPENLYQDGFHNIVSTDLSPVVVEKMAWKAASKGMQGVRWEVADMCALQYSDDEFDAVIEKGTLDVLFVDERSPWDPQPELRARVHAMLHHTHRVLRPGGCFISITFAQPHFRKQYLLADQYTWSCDVATFGSDFHYFVYHMAKGKRDPVLHAVQPLIRGEHSTAACSLQHDHMDNEDYLLSIDTAAND